MRVFWYVSAAKLDAYDQPGGLLSRATLKGKLQILGVEFEAGVQPSSSELTKKLARFETAAEIEGYPESDEIVAGARPMLFGFGGPAARASDEWGNAFWVATVNSTTAVLVGGSAKHAIGAGAAKYELSPSFNPLGEVMNLVEGHEVYNLPLVWAYVMGEQANLVGMDSLPRARGIAVFAGIVSVEDEDRRDATSRNFASLDHIDRVVVGSPVFVEQVDESL